MRKRSQILSLKTLTFCDNHNTIQWFQITLIITRESQKLKNKYFYRKTKKNERNRCTSEDAIEQIFSPNCENLQVLTSTILNLNSNSHNINFA